MDIIVLIGDKKVDVGKKMIIYCIAVTTVTEETYENIYTVIWQLNEKKYKITCST